MEEEENIFARALAWLTVLSSTLEAKVDRECENRFRSVVLFTKAHICGAMLTGWVRAARQTRLRCSLHVASLSFGGLVDQVPDGTVARQIETARIPLKS